MRPLTTNEPAQGRRAEDCRLATVRAYRAAWPWLLAIVSAPWLLVLVSCVLGAP